jgi:hypothetical protein
VHKTSVWKPNAKFGNPVNTLFLQLFLGNILRYNNFNISSREAHNRVVDNFIDTNLCSSNANAKTNDGMDQEAECHVASSLASVNNGFHRKSIVQYIDSLLYHLSGLKYSCGMTKQEVTALNATIGSVPLLLPLNKHVDIFDSKKGDNVDMTFVKEWARSNIRRLVRSKNQQKIDGHICEIGKANSLEKQSLFVFESKDHSENEVEKILNRAPNSTKWDNSFTWNFVSAFRTELNVPEKFEKHCMLRIICSQQKPHTWTLGPMEGGDLVSNGNDTSEPQNTLESKLTEAAGIVFALDIEKVQSESKFKRKQFIDMLR